MKRFAAILILCVFLGSSGPISAQGQTEYCNFETPQVKPITIGSLTSPGGTTKTFLYACNTPDNAIEVFDITGALRDNPTPVDRIPVGLEPVSVVFKRITIGSTTKDMLYSVNWLGDSVTYVELSLTDTPQFQFVITREVRVTDPTAFHHAGTKIQRSDDEPMHLTVVDRPLTIPPPPQTPTGCGQFLIVTKRSASSYTMLHPFNGTVMAARNNTGGTPAGSGANVIMTSNGNEGPTGNGQVVFGQALLASPNATKALKHPHTVLWRPGKDQFWVLGHKGGGSQVTPSEGLPFGYDLGLWGIEMPASNSSLQNQYFIQTGLGAVNFNMAFNAGGSQLYIVGTEAQDGETGNEELAENTSSGFVKTMLYRLQFAPGPRTLQARDLNIASFTGGVPTFVDGLTQSLSHAVDVAVYQPAGGGTFAVVAAFNSSRIGLVNTADASADNWTISRIGVESEQGNPTQLATDPPMAAGPRGLAVLKTATLANDRIYSLNRLDQTITIVQPNAGTLQFIRQFPLQRPGVEPAHIRDGRKFLYSTKFSGNSSAAGFDGHLTGFVACASCHVDARSDNFAWRLTARAQPGLEPHIAAMQSPPPTDEFDALEIIDPTGKSLTFPVDLEPLLAEANAKGPMVTQSLQGLSNWEVGGDWLNDEDEGGTPGDDAIGNPFDDLITNAPFHWRGDKENFRHFNEAFVNLQGTASAAPPPVVPAGGLTTLEMKSYERFIHSIHYPPNPLQGVQDRKRPYSGTQWSPGNKNESEAAADDSTGALRGLKLFHIQAFTDTAAVGRSCIQCHSFPEGSNNRVTDFGTQPQETTALRALFQKEARLALNGERVPSNLLTGEFGLFHFGKRKDQNDFLDAFVDFFRPPPVPQSPPNRSAAEDTENSDLDVGSSFSSVMLAERFTLAQAEVLTVIGWWGTYDQAPPPVTDDFRIDIYTDTGGLPGTLLASRHPGNLVSRTVTGQSIGGSAEQSYAATVAPNGISLAAGTYWLSIYGNTVGYSGTWRWGRSSVGNGEAASNDMSGWSPVSVFGDLCFEIATDNTEGEKDEKRDRLTEFMREFDSGTAPIVGLSHMVMTTATDTVITNMEGEAGEANCGIAVFARVKNGAVFENRGYWYKLTASGGPMYKRAGVAEELSTTNLLMLLSQGGFMIFRATPLGSDRRIASFGLASSDPPESTINVPSGLAIAGTTPNSANDPVVELTRNWNPVVDPSDAAYPNRFAWLGDGSHRPLTLRLLIRFQDALSTAGVLGISRRHDPSRRLQITGTDLVYGAKIRLTFDNVDIGDGGVLVRQVELPIYPTTATSGGQRIWETAVEFDALALYTMILGGPGNPNVEAVFRDPDASATLAPVAVKIEASNVTGGWSTQETRPFNYAKVP